MKKPTNNPLKPLFRLLRQTNLIIFVIVVGAGIASYIFILSSIVLKAEEGSTHQTSSNSNKFDEAIIDQIEKLETSSNIKAPSLPSGRTNPFDE